MIYDDMLYGSDVELDLSSDFEDSLVIEQVRTMESK